MSKKLTVDEWNQRLIKMNPYAKIIGNGVINGKDIYKIHCNDCNGIFDVSIASLKSAYSKRQKNKNTQKFCPICSGNMCQTGINDIATLRSDLTKYFVNIEDAKTHTVGSGEKVLLRCPDCGKTKTLSILQLSSLGFSCDYCSDSISTPNKMLRGLMAQLPVQNLKFEYKAAWTCGRYYDCYFTYDNQEYLVEIDGEQHIRDTEWSTKQKQEDNDRFKSEIANKNNYILIRIPAYDSNLNHIKENIFNSELATIFDLNSVDWNEIYDKAVSNLYLEICDYYNQHINEMKKDIAKRFHISTVTLTHILCKMSDLGFCEYDKEASFKNGRKHWAKWVQSRNDRKAVSV